MYTEHVPSLVHTSEQCRNPQTHIMLGFQNYKYVQLLYHTRTLNSICYACLVLVKNNDLESINVIQISTVMRASFFAKYSHNH